jgi:uncharacterized damage-inducible protein DinB
MHLPSHISTRLQYQHKTLVDIIDGFSEEQIRRQIIPGKWSIFEHIVHLQTYQHTFIDRTKLILQGQLPFFDRYTPEGDPAFLDNCSRSFREIMQDMITTRKEMANEMLHFSEADFAKKGIHPIFGELNLQQWINFFLLHEGHHLFAILKLTGEIRKEVE